MTDFIERSLRRLGRQFADHVSVPGDKLTATRELRAIMQGRVVSRGDDDYPRTRKIWNKAAETQPALFAVCETSTDVQAAVRSARQHGLSLSVRGGGHSWAGSALCPDGLVIDLSKMRQVVVDPHSSQLSPVGRRSRTWRPPLVSTVWLRHWATVVKSAWLASPWAAAMALSTVNTAWQRITCLGPRWCSRTGGA